MRLLILIAFILAAPLGPTGFQLIDGNGVVALTWTQQSDANVVCVEQSYRGVVTSYGCMESLAGPHAVTLPAAPDGTSYAVSEWHRSPDNEWTAYGYHEALTIPYRVYIPAITR